jgi:oligopeptide transport system ATP-binding protein
LTTARDAPLLEARDLVRHFPSRSGPPWRAPAPAIRAVDGVSFHVDAHETLSVVGESGCGKTTSARLILHLDRPTAGMILFRGKAVARFDNDELRRYRSAVQAVFQDPWSSMNPRWRIRSIIAEPIDASAPLSQSDRRARVVELLEAVGLDSSSADRFPHEFSGGMRQRIAIARALAIDPAVVVLDEPVSALDVSVRAQVLNLLRDLQERTGMSYLMISHNLANVRYLSHRVAVMYLGKIVESASAEDLFGSPLHPYTQALISASTTMKRDQRRKRIVLNPDLPSPSNPPAGCRFNTRCPFVMDRCRTEPPEFRELAPGHWAACHLY